ncbi:T9SS type B sorting domain-containing protein [Flavobacterium gelidilacus]|uniref:T9SS type B sorting domain-containing protein n=1 Tax=Flavobacterium gelidilacus TaxID=206041 RepID=UPI00041047FB|nr:T9SS type B sorting domain-containing protein [Flavobacterium gelidilacus]
MKKLLLLYFLLIFNFAYSQGEANIWYFGQNAGLNFNTNPPTALIDGQLNTGEGCATISNGAGQLLFYTDGITVWDRNHSIMPNGTGLLGHPSSTQSAIIVPKPGSSTIYYIFTCSTEFLSDGINYSEVDISLNGGFGDVTANKNINLMSGSVCEKLTSVKHANGNDYWVVAHDFGNNNFYSFKVSSLGVDTSPVINSIGAVISLNENKIGYLKFSPNGTKLAAANNFSGIDLFDFNSSNGQLSNYINLNNNINYGVEFSPSGERLYIANRIKIFQYDLTVTNIAASELLIYQAPSTAYLFFGALQLGVDGKIYCAVYDEPFISTIHNPDAIGLGCNFQYQDFYLGGKTSYLGLPTFIQSYFNSGILAQNNCLGEITNFDLTNNTTITSVVWDFGDGSANSTALNPPHTYLTAGSFTVSATITSGTQTITRTKQIVVSEVPVIANSIANQEVCGTVAMSYDLSQFNATVLGSQSTTTFGVAYFSSQANAENHTNILATTQNLALGTTTYYAKVYNTANTNCNAITSFDVNLFQQPIANVVSNYIICESLPYNGIEQFNLQTKTATVLGSQSSTNFSVSYHASQSDADTNTAPLPLLYSNTLSLETIYVRIENNLNTDCFATTTFNIQVIQQPTILTVSDYVVCDDATNNVIEQFDLSTKTNEILNGQSATVFEVKYYLTFANAQNDTNAITTPINNTTNNQVVYYSIAAIGNANCKVIDSFKLVVSNLPIANTPNAIFICDDISNDGIGVFNLAQNNSVVLGSQNASSFTVTYYVNQTDADNAISPLNNNYTNISNPQTIFVRIQNNTNTNCFATTSFQIGLYKMPIANQPQNLHICDAGNDATETFDLSQQTSIVLGSQNPAEFAVTYHNSQQDANNDSNPLLTNYTSNQLVKTIYVRIENILSANCFSTSTFQLIIHPNPILNINQSYTICEGNPITITAPSGFTSYNWSNGSTSNQTTITQAGQYTLTVTKNYGTIICSTTENITVVNSNIATIEEIITEDWTDNSNIISVSVSGDGDYEYSLNGINYQDSPIFSGLQSGEYTVYVKDKNECGIKTETIYLLIYPKFFTPNNDGYNDTWKVKFSNNEPNIKTSIFDRYGKLIYIINGNLKSWDGMYNGVPLPSTDYWFVVTRENGKEFKGHFTLKR